MWQSSAVLEDADLSRENLSNVDFSGMSLQGANLSGANLEGANLSGANLSNIKLHDADLSGANLSRCVGLPQIALFPLDATIAAAVEAHGLDMTSWHSDCVPAQCRAGWAVTLHPQGEDLAAELGTSAAAALIYATCSKAERVPNWYANNTEALADIRRLAEM